MWLVLHRDFNETQSLSDALKLTAKEVDKVKAEVQSLNRPSTPFRDLSAASCLTRDIDEAPSQ